MPEQPSTVVSALAEALRSEPGRPLVTMYDDATGERVELSVTTFDNWVSKLANLFTADWGLAPGDLVGIDLPPHWQSMAAAVAAWTAGLTVSLDPTESVAARIVGPGWEGDPRRSGEVLATSMRPMGQGFAGALPAGWLDWTSEVPAQPDALLMPQPLDPSDVALIAPAGAATHTGLVERGLAAARACGLDRAGRLLTDLNPADPTGIDIALLAPLVTGSSVVLLVNAAPDRVGSVSAQERVTCAALSERPHPRPDKAPS